MRSFFRVPFIAFPLPFGLSPMSAIVHTHCYADNSERHALAMCEFMCTHVYMNACLGVVAGARMRSASKHACIHLRLELLCCRVKKSVCDFCHYYMDIHNRSEHTCTHTCVRVQLAIASVRHVHTCIPHTHAQQLLHVLRDDQLLQLTCLTHIPARYSSLIDSVIDDFSPPIISMPNVRPHLHPWTANWRRTKLHCSPLLIKVDSCDAMFCSCIEPHLSSPKMKSVGSIRRAIVNSMNKAMSVGPQCSIMTPTNPFC